MSGNVTTSATEAWCRTTSPAVSDPGCTGLFGGVWRLEGLEKFGKGVLPVLSTKGPWV